MALYTQYFFATLRVMSETSGGDPDELTEAGLLPRAMLILFIFPLSPA
jgi:hypothetical protein